MFRAKTFWAVVLGIVSYVLIFEAKTKLGYGAVGGRILNALVIPGPYVVTFLYPPSSAAGNWTRFLRALAIACNFLTYAFFWYVCIWIASYFRKSRHPYDHEGSNLVPPRVS